METESFGQKATRKTKIFLKRLIIFLVIALTGWFAFTYFGVNAEGIRAGFVLKVSKQGVIFKTYEGQLNLETFGSLKGTTAVAETFDFSVETSDENVIKDLETVALSGERVNLRYIKRYVSYPWRGESKYFVKSVERLGANRAPAAQ